MGYKFSNLELFLHIFLFQSIVLIVNLEILIFLQMHTNSVWLISAIETAGNYTAIREIRIQDFIKKVQYGIKSHKHM